METVKVSFNLPKSELDFLKSVAKDRDINVTQALRRAIAAERLVEEVEQKKGRLLVEEGNELSEVRFR